MKDDNVVILGASQVVLPVDICERVRPWVLRGIRLYQLGSPISYSISFGIMPDGNGNAAPRLLLYFETPSAIVGGPPEAHVVMCDTHIAEDAVDGVCKNAINQLLQQRSNRLRVNG